MTPEEKRISVAGACGIKKVQHPSSKIGCYGYYADGIATSVPDYQNDFDAMHEAWEVAIKPSKLHIWNFEANLRRIVEKESEHPATDAFAPLVTNATAEQRFEAFGLTLGLWT